MRRKAQPATTLIRALGIGTDREIIDLVVEDERLLRTLEIDTSDSFESDVQEIYKRQKPGEPACRFPRLRDAGLPRRTLRAAGRTASAPQPGSK